MQLFADSHVVEGFLKSWGMILASEIGDKTFFIAAIMAMKHSRTVVSCRSSAHLC
jgi:putative Ca2+/H+ antiporter (TMEM165/GDT1 family)